MDKLEIIQGATFFRPVRWGMDPVIYKAITEVVQLAPLRFKVPEHELPNGWKTEVVSVKGMKEINSSGKGEPSDFHFATVIDPDVIEFNDVNALDFSQYVSGGMVRYFTPVDLANKKAVLTIWDKSTGEVYLELDSEGNGLVLDEVNYSINVTIVDEVTSVLAWKKGEFALDVEDSITGAVTRVASGIASVDVTEYLVAPV